MNVKGKKNPRKQKRGAKPPKGEHKNSMNKDENIRESEQ